VNDRGFATPIMLALLLLAALLCLATADAANVLVARTRAQSAADAAALAAAAAQWPFLSKDETPEDAAQAVAEQNGAVLESCDCPLRGARATVEVSIDTHIRMLGVAPPRVTAKAQSRIDLDRVFAPHR
jgi:secretion/DNA translocation related TadE-like protein